jgi:hypothetical protein
VTLLMRNLRAHGAIRSDQRGRIEIERSRLAAAACECHGIMRLEVEEIFSMKMARSRPAILANDERISGVELGEREALAGQPCSATRPSGARSA